MRHTPSLARIPGKKTPPINSPPTSAAPVTSVPRSEGFSGSEDVEVWSCVFKPAVPELTPSSTDGSSPSSMLGKVCSVERAVGEFQNGQRTATRVVDGNNWLTDEAETKLQQSNILRNVDK